MIPVPGPDWINSFEWQSKDGHSASPDIYRGNKLLGFFFFQTSFTSHVFTPSWEKGKTLKNTSRTLSLWSETADKCSPTSLFYLPSIKHTTAIEPLNSSVNWGFCFVFFQNFVVSLNRSECDCSKCGWKDIIGTHTLIAWNQFSVPSLIRVCSACLFSTF